MIQGYKFETLSTLPHPWAETDREYIENRDSLVVSNKAQYCSVVRTGVGKTILCLGGEVDASTSPPTSPNPLAPPSKEGTDSLGRMVCHAQTHITNF